MLVVLLIGSIKILNKIYVTSAHQSCETLQLIEVETAFSHPSQAFAMQAWS